MNVDGWWKRRKGTFTDNLMIDQSQNTHICCTTAFQIVGARCNFWFVMCHSIEKRPCCLQRKSLMLAMRSLHFSSQTTNWTHPCHNIGSLMLSPLESCFIIFLECPMLRDSWVTQRLPCIGHANDANLRIQNQRFSQRPFNIQLFSCQGSRHQR